MESHCACKRSRAVSISRSRVIVVHIVLHTLCFITAASTDELNNARVISFEGERDLTPIGSPLTFTCTVQGRAVWNFGQFEVNTLNANAAGNISNVHGLPGINISDITNSNGYHVSKLHLSSNRMAGLNSTNISCGASKGQGFAPVGEEEIPIRIFGSPTAPGTPMVSGEAHLAAEISWEPSFLPYNMVPQYKVYIDGELEATVGQPLYEFKRNQASCDVRKVTIEAFNEVGSNISEELEIVLPSVPDVSPIPSTVSTQLAKSEKSSFLTISFQPANSCSAYSVTGYTIKARSNSTAMVQANVSSLTSGPTVSAILQGLEDNTLYRLTITANNVVGSAETEPIVFSTTDVASLTAMEMNEGSLSLRCEFVEGSNALGCQVNFETLTRAGNFSRVLYRETVDSPAVAQVISIPTNLSCYHRVTVFDIEYDNTTSTLGIEGEIQANASRPCTAPPMSDPVPGVSLELIVGIPVAVVALVLLLLIIVVVCCLLRSPHHIKGRGSQVWANGFRKDPERYPSVSHQDIKSSLPNAQYDSVYSFKARTDSQASDSSQYQQLQGIGRSQLPLPPSPEESSTCVYSQLQHCQPEPYLHATNAVPFEELYDQPLVTPPSSKSPPSDKSPASQSPYCEPVGAVREPYTAAFRRQPSRDSQRVSQLALQQEKRAEPYEVAISTSTHQVSEEHVYQTVEEAARTERSRRSPPTSSPPTGHYAEVADARISGRIIRINSKGRKNSRLTLPQNRSDSRTSLSQV